MEHTAHDIVSESLQDELRAIDFYLLAADVAPTRAARVAARRFAREEEQHLDELIEWIEGADDPELHAVLQNVHLLQYRFRPPDPLGAALDGDVSAGGRCRPGSHAVRDRPRQGAPGARLSSRVGAPRTRTGRPSGAAHALHR